ncbi:MAG: bifunctional non-ous end joining protein LigD, partial [Variibacter sp.]|nr:bifunctional non-ous end joining protein LigD [Variibacter sp.]
VKLSEHFDEKGSVLLKHACGMQLEGIISKIADGPYRSGRNGDWIKTKCSERQEFIITGFKPATNDPRAIGALILGYYEEGELQYAGRVGTGYTNKVAREIWQKLQPLARTTPPFKALPAEERGRGAGNPRWVEPTLVAEIDFRGWTGGKRLRHGSFKGLREDKSAAEVVREVPAMPAQQTQPRGAVAKVASSSKTPSSSKTEKTGKARGASKTAKAADTQVGSVRLSNPDRVYWEEVGVTKQNLADFYASIWDWIAPQVVGRALSLVRCPEGATGQCFFQKHASAGLDAKYLKLVLEDGDHVISVDSLDGLIALVQAGVLEVHVRGSTIERLDAANRLVFDLDPGPGTTWEDIVRAARDVRDRLAALKFESFLKTSGGKGLHVVLPTAHTPWDEAKAFARSIAIAMAGDEPSRYTAVLSKKERQGKIFVDYLRNSREATAIAAYSTRARKGAPVSVPITWKELGALPGADRYTLQNLNARLGRLRKDPWADIDKHKPKLPKVIGRR